MEQRHLSVTLFKWFALHRWLWIVIGVAALANMSVNLSRLWLNVGYVALMHDRPVQAEQFFRAATNTDVRMTAGWRGLGEALLRQDKRKAALGSYDTALILRPDDLLARVGRANARQTGGDLVGAMEDWRATGSVSLVIQLGKRAWELDHDVRSAGALFQLAIEMAPEDWRGYYYLAAVLNSSDSSRREEAYKLLQVGQRLSSDNPTVLMLLGQVEYLTTRYDRAIQTFSQYIELKPDDFLGWYWRGLCWKTVGAFSHAVPDLRQSATLYPADPSPHFQLAEVLEQTGDKRGALIEYQTVLQLIPEHAESQQATSRLKDSP